MIALPLGCDPYECPPGWTDGETNPRCTPPDSHVQEVEERIETGFYGYANKRIYVSTDAYEMVECEVGDLARDTECRSK